MMTDLRKKWLFFGALGLTLVGLGLSIMGEALIAKYEHLPFQSWFWLGALSLVIVNGGLAFFGKAVTLRVKLDRLTDVNNP